MALAKVARKQKKGGQFPSTLQQGGQMRMTATLWDAGLKKILPAYRVVDTTPEGAGLRNLRLFVVEDLHEVSLLQHRLGFLRPSPVEAGPLSHHCQLLSYAQMGPKES